jgi:hypothetical protein
VLGGQLEELDAELPGKFAAAARDETLDQVGGEVLGIVIGFLAV